MSEKTKRLKYYKFIFKDDGYPLGIEHYEDGEKVSVHWFTQREARALRDFLNQQELCTKKVKKPCHESEIIDECNEGTMLNCDMIDDGFTWKTCHHGKLHGRAKG